MVVAFQQTGRLPGTTKSYYITSGDVAIWHRLWRVRTKPLWQIERGTSEGSVTVSQLLERGEVRLNADEQRVEGGSIPQLGLVVNGRPKVQTCRNVLHNRYYSDSLQQ